MGIGLATAQGYATAVMRKLGVHRQQDIAAVLGPAGPRATPRASRLRGPSGEDRNGDGSSATGAATR